MSFDLRVYHPLKLIYTRKDSVNANLKHSNISLSDRKITLQSVWCDIIRAPPPKRKLFFQTSVSERPGICDIQTNLINYCNLPITPSKIWPRAFPRLPMCLHIARGWQTIILFHQSTAQRTTDMIADQQTGKNSGPALTAYRN
jgi:hypothetical protein